MIEILTVSAQNNNDISLQEILIKNSIRIKHLHVEQQNLKQALNNHNYAGIIFNFTQTDSNYLLKQVAEISTTYTLPVFLYVSVTDLLKWYNQITPLDVVLIEKGGDDSIFVHNIKKVSQLYARNRGAAEINKKLTREAYHRIKNNLSTLEGFLMLEGLNTKSSDGQSAYTNASLKVSVIKELNHRLLKDGDGQVKIYDFLKDLLQRIMLTNNAPAQNLRFNSGLVNLMVSEKLAITLGIMVNELITNALKYGSENKATLCVCVNLQLNEANALVLSVEDNGKGFVYDQKNQSTHSSEGLNLIESLCANLGLNLSIASEISKGTKCTVIVPTYLLKQ